MGLTAEDVRLADSAAEKQKLLLKLRWEQEELKKKLEENQKKALDEYYDKERQVRDAQRELDLAGDARLRVVQAVPLEIRQAADRSAALLRSHDGEVDIARRAREAAESLLRDRQEWERKTGFKIEQGELEERHRLIAERRAEERGCIDTHAALERKAVESKAVLDKAVSEARQAALKAKR